MLLFRNVVKQADLIWKQVEILECRINEWAKMFACFIKQEFYSLRWKNWHVEIKNMIWQDAHFLAVSQRSVFDKFRELMHLISAEFQHLKWLWLAQWGTPNTSSKQASYLSVIGPGGAGEGWACARCSLVFTPAFFKPPRSTYRQNRNYSCVVAWNVHVCPQKVLHVMAQMPKAGVRKEGFFTLYIKSKI